MNTSYLTKSQLDFFKPYFDLNMIKAIQITLHGKPRYLYRKCNFADKLKYTFVEVSEAMKKTHRIIDEYFKLDSENQNVETFKKMAIENCDYPDTYDYIWDRYEYLRNYEDTYLRICAEYFEKTGYVYHVSSETIRRNSILVHMFNKEHDVLSEMALNLHKFNAIYGDPNHSDAPKNPIGDANLLGENLKFFFPLSTYASPNSILNDLENRSLLDVVFAKNCTKVKANTRQEVYFEDGVIVKKTVTATVTREIYE